MTVSGEMNVARCPKCHALDVRASRARLSRFLGLGAISQDSPLRDLQKPVLDLVPCSRRPRAGRQGQGAQEDARQDQGEGSREVPEWQ